LLRFFLFLLLLSNSAFAASDLAFAGYSGFLNVPSARVLDHGQADIQYSDQAVIAGQYGHYRNVSGAVGIFPLLEVGGRVSWQETQSNLYANGNGHRDLSANVKVQAPFIPQHWFTLAAGVQDLGGETGHFNASYLAAGRQFGPLEMTVGYGRTDTQPRYLDGAFAALSYRATSWLNLIAEHDAQDLRVGAGLTTPARWLGGVQLKGKVLAYDRGDSDSRDDTGRHFFSLGVSIPLGGSSSGEGSTPSWEQHSCRDCGDSTPLWERHSCRDCRSGTPAATDPADQANSHSQVKTIRGRSAAPTGMADSPVAADSADIDPTIDPTIDPAIIGALLVKAGYERVGVSTAGGELTIRFENNLFNRDERAALRDVAQRLHALGLQQALGYPSARLVLLNQNLPVLSRTAWLNGEEPRVTAAAEQPLPQQWDYQGSYGPAWKPRLTLSPNVTTAVATEYGVLDSSLALGTEVSSSLWTGALASATWNFNVYESEDFERGGAFYADRQRTDLKELDLQQTFRLHPQLYTSFHIGRYNTDYEGWLNDTLLLSSDRRHSVGFLSGNFRYIDDNSLQPRQLLARYSYHLTRHDVQLSIHGGEFFEGDTGFRVDSRFWFGDYAVILSYKNTEAEFVGLGVVIPLTPRRDRQTRYAQLRGNPDWSYVLQTRINEDANFVAFGSATIVRPANTLERLYLNRLRLR